MMALRLYLVSLLAVLPLLAQTLPVDKNKGKPEVSIQETARAVNSARQYCEAVDQFSLTHQARLFAESPSDVPGHSKWVEFLSRAEWERAGKPTPVAFATHRSGRIVHVAMTLKDEAVDGTIYASYCYTPEGKLARLESGPRVREACDDAYFQCQLTFGVASFYSDDGRRIAIVTHGPDPRALKSERTSFSWVEINPPLYLTVSDLPFGAALRESTSLLRRALREVARPV